MKALALVLAGVIVGAFATTLWDVLWQQHDHPGKDCHATER